MWGPQQQFCPHGNLSSHFSHNLVSQFFLEICEGILTLFFQFQAFLASEGERKREAEVARAELAYARWRMLIRAIKTRSQLEEQYGSQAVQEKISEPPKKIPQKEDKMEAKEGGNQKPLVTGKGHEHSFLEELETFDEENGIRRRKCSCGYTFEVEEL